MTLLAMLSGCSKGPPVAEVTGRVTYQGKPVPFARVEFQPAGAGKSSLGWTDDNGDYTAMYTLSQEGVLIGKHKVSLTMYPPKGQTAPPVPAEFAKGKEIEVQPGSNRLDIEL